MIRWGASLEVLRLARGRRNVIAVPMGDVALPARVLALREGSALAYAPVENATAPGQATLDAVKDLYRADKLRRKTRVYGVIGNPIGHSLSPVLQNAGFQARKMDAVFLPFLVRDLRDFLDSRSRRWESQDSASRCRTSKRFCGIWTIAIRWPRRLAL